MLERKLQRCAANTRTWRCFISSEHFCSLIPPSPYSHIPQIVSVEKKEYPSQTQTYIFIQRVVIFYETARTLRNGIWLIKEVH